MGAFILPTTLEIARAQSYPTHPVTMIIPYPAGGPVDALGRVVAEEMRVSLGQPIIIENVSGANGSIGTGRMARARPDGYTIGLGGVSTHVLNAALYSLPYDVLNDFAAVSALAASPFILFGRRALPANDLKELIAWLRANPNKASAAIVGTSPQLVTHSFKRKAGRN
jgi:tripartite-type tricarboxylate transporter receptor subunit TctC